ncbi:hypothetical protein BGZ90_009746, partial [Linnemannia elongata]
HPARVHSVLLPSKPPPPRGMLGSDSGSSDLSEASSLSSDNSSGSEADIKHTPHQQQRPPKQNRVVLPHSRPSAPASSSIAPSTSVPSSRPAPSALGQPYPYAPQGPSRPLQPKYHSSSSSSGSDSGSGSGNSSGDDSTDLDDDGNHGQGKRPPQHIRAGNKYPSKAALLQQQQSRKDATAKKPKHDKNSPISLSDSLP